jgi:selenocysteine lyase/cysteine desulfurase
MASSTGTLHLRDPRVRARIDFVRVSDGSARGVRILAMNLTRRQVLGAAAAAAVTSVSRVAAQSTDDPLGVRQDFPALRELTFLNTAYAGLIPQPVADAARQWIDRRATRSYTVGEMFARADEARALLARMIGAGEDEIAFISSTTEGENIVVNSLGFAAGDNVVYDDLVYPSTPAIYQRLAATRGVEIRVVKSRNGAAPVEEFAKLVDKRTRLISVAWVNNNSGYRHDMKALAALAHHHGAYLYSDAVQFIGTGPVDVHAEQIDFCTAGTYKWLMAGFGVAAFYVRRELLEKIQSPYVGWRSRAGQERNAKKFEYATLPFGELYELAAALEYLQRIGLDRIETRSQALVSRLRSGLDDRKIAVATPENNRSPIVSFYIRRPSAEAAKLLEAERVRVSVQDVPATAGAPAATRVRVAVAFFNNEADVDRMLATAETLIA